jgi:hypothetical protein
MGPDGLAALLERDQSMSTLAELLSGVRASSEGRLVLVGGEAGVGKTALLRSFCEAQGKSVRVLWGGCEPLRTARPLGPFVDVAEATGGEVERLAAAAARPHELAVALLRELRRHVPTVLVLEDVHWADEATLDVLTLLAGRIGSAPALVLASYREDELDSAEQLRLVLGELVRRPGRLKLEPLSRATVAELAGRHGIDGPELYRRTGGNPFFVTEVLATGGDQIPETVRDAILARAGRLSGPARRLLEAVAVVPGQADLWLLEALAPEWTDRIEECLASGVLTPGPAHLAFRHELARLAIEEIPRTAGLGCIAPRWRHSKPVVETTRTSRASPITPTPPASMRACSAGRRARRSERRVPVRTARRPHSTRGRSGSPTGCRWRSARSYCSVARRSAG